MKKRLFVVSLVVVALLLVGYRISCKTPPAELSAQQRVLAIFEDGGCLSCHSAEPQLPFYASFPVMGDIVKADSENGYKLFDIEPMIKALKSGEALSAVDVARVEKAAMDGDMPMAKYYLVHWGSQMTAAKSSIVAQWAEQWRAAHYNDGLGASLFVR